MVNDSTSEGVLSMRCNTRGVCVCVCAEAYIEALKVTGQKEQYYDMNSEEAGSSAGGLR